ncbi:NfeD family protein [Granulosicoccaceae sp. 1_MG-2023]|nr:NfeD family protein [Granulosicoccaceae sp. 1_MG-2023]
MEALSTLAGHLVFWHWFILAVIFLGLEILLPTTYMMWLAFGAAVAGALAWLSPALSWQAQLVIFALASVLSTVLGRWLIARHPITTDHPQLNRRGQQYIGRVLTLDEAIVNGRGYVNVDDTRWRAEGPDLPAGARVSVVAVDGTCLVVEAAD